MAVSSIDPRACLGGAVEPVQPKLRSVHFGTGTTSSSEMLQNVTTSSQSSMQISWLMISWSNTQRGKWYAHICQTPARPVSEGHRQRASPTIARHDAGPSKEREREVTYRTAEGELAGNRHIVRRISACAAKAAHAGAADALVCVADSSLAETRQRQIVGRVVRCQCKNTSVVHRAGLRGCVWHHGLANTLALVQLRCEFSFPNTGT